MYSLLCSDVPIQNALTVRSGRFTCSRLTLELAGEALRHQATKRRTPVAAEGEVVLGRLGRPALLTMRAVLLSWSLRR